MMIINRKHSLNVRVVNFTTHFYIFKLQVHIIIIIDIVKVNKRSTYLKGIIEQRCSSITIICIRMSYILD